MKYELIARRVVGLRSNVQWVPLPTAGQVRSKYLVCNVAYDILYVHSSPLFSLNRNRRLFFVLLFFFHRRVSRIRPCLWKQATKPIVVIPHASTITPDGERNEIGPECAFASGECIFSVWTLWTKSTPTLSCIGHVIQRLLHPVRSVFCCLF